MTTKPKPINRKLYNVKIEVELCVFAQDSQEAIRVGKENAGSEAIEFGAAEAKLLNQVSDIPRTWTEAIPYYPAGASINNKTCKQIVMEKISERHDKVASKVVDNDVQHIMEIQESIQRVPKEEVKPETRPDPIPPELEWKETETGKKLPPLRFFR